MIYDESSAQISMITCVIIVDFKQWSPEKSKKLQKWQVTHLKMSISYAIFSKFETRGNALTVY